MKSHLVLLLAGALALIGVSAGPAQRNVEHEQQRHFGRTDDQLSAPFDPRDVEGWPGTKKSLLTPTNSTFFNNAQTPGADPYVMYDAPSGYYVSLIRLLSFACRSY